MSDFIITVADPSFLEDVMAIENSSFSLPWSRQSIEYCFSNYPNRVTVALLDGKVVGFAVAMIMKPEVEIADLAVLKEYRNRGIGRELMKEIISFAGGIGCTDFFLEVRASNSPAKSVYSSLGFKEYAKIRNYYRSPMEDAVLMKMRITEKQNEI
ncbi:MAG: ribosomal protein S18-alanine N-acetyltransferase [Clostridia bacterium]|nr:ribosomal protein S18-alanine N-acetyltransferase [Clostridia bacterium]